MVNYDPSEISLSKALELIKPYEKAFVIDETDDKMLLGYRLIIPKMYSENPLLREIRGIVFNKEDGKVLQRPFHKFFNYGEVNCEAKPSDKGFITEKLDGSMIATTWHNNDLLISITKGLNHIAVSKAKNYIMSNPQYLELIKSFKGYTLLFEYLQSSYSVVIPYEKDELVTEHLHQATLKKIIMVFHGWELVGIEEDYEVLDGNQGYIGILFISSSWWA